MASGRRSPRWTFALVSAGGVMMTLDVTVVNVALSDIARDLGAGLDRVQWTVSAYSLAFGALILTAGALSDRMGRRAVFTLGMVLFTLASAGCGLAPDATALIAARAAQGLGGAMVFAPTLALMAAAYEGARRQRAIAAFAAIASAAGALGPLVGGVLVEALGWRWIFLVNVPIGALVVAGALARMPESAAPRGARRRIDALGALLAVGALLALHYPLVAGPESGWAGADVTVSAAVGVVLAVALVASQRRGDGLIDLTLLRVRAFSGAAVLGFLARMSSLGVLAFVTLWLQSTHAYSPLEVGLQLVPLTGSLLLAGLFMARLQRAFSAASLVAGGFAAQAGGLLVLAAAAAPGGGGAAGGRVATAAGLVLLGVGGAVIFPPLMGVAVGAAPADRAGMASGLTNACYPLGTATGVALFGALFSARLDEGLGLVQGPGAGGGPGGAGLRDAVATGRLEMVDPALQPLARSAFSGAFSTVCLASALVCLLGVLAARTLRDGPEAATGTAKRPRSRIPQTS
ncbi:MFS transporter [Streptomyces ficellus]|uniref:MFS transporter n=1 Tax=Streptomyces ficellus TaxID=1977088 RepID=A0ABT7Z4B9_9ACTN|nr:MFS transporter [Streptomyces ficellus]MDN3294310.1 MFS transporter [Streptomyces ficellus]